MYNIYLQHMYTPLRVNAGAWTPWRMCGGQKTVILGAIACALPRV